MLLGLISEGESIAFKALTVLDVTQQDARRVVSEMEPGDPENPPVGHIPFTQTCKKALEYSLREALEMNHNYIGTEHVLLGLVREDCGAVQVLEKLGVRPDQVRETVRAILASYAPPKPVVSDDDANAVVFRCVDELNRLSDRHRRAVLAYLGAWFA